MSLTPAQLDFFKLTGYLHLPGLVPPKELAALHRETKALIGKGIDHPVDDPSYKYGLDAQDKSRKCLFRIDDLLTRHDPHGSFRLLLAYPPLLQAISDVVGGDYFSSPIHSLVFKIPHRGYPVPWHQDPVPILRYPVFNADIYLDKAYPENGGLWVIPGSHLGGYHANNPQFVKSRTAGKNEDAPGAIPVNAEAGDVLFHVSTLLHGSFWNRGKTLRRTIYFAVDHYQDVVLKPQNEWPQNLYLTGQQQVEEAIALRKKTYPQESAFEFRALPSGMLST
jgi:Phytanoyl-CoA dioxygenase (PhyH)